MPRFALVLAALALAAPTALFAEDRLTLDRAVQEALAHNASLRAVRAGSAEAAARASEARAGWFPRVSVAESWQRGDQPVFAFSSLLAARQFAAADFAVDALNHPGAITFFQTSIGFEQLLFDGGRQRSAAERAALRRDLADLAVDESAAGLAVRVTETFGRLLAADATTRAVASELDAARADLGRARNRRDAGMATDADVLALSARVAALEQMRIESLGGAAVAHAELNRLMGAPIEREFQIVEPPSFTSAVEAGAPLGTLLEEADRARPELRRAAATVRMAELDRTSARSALVPQVVAQAGVDVSGTRFTDRAASWAVGGALRWNLSLGGAQLANLRAAADGDTRARAEADDVKAAVHVEVVTARSNVESAVARQAVGRAAVDQARESQRIIRDRFDAGVAGVTDVLRASAAVLDAESELTAATVDAMVSDAMLRRALGRRP